MRERFGGLLLPKKDAFHGKRQDGPLELFVLALYDQQVEKERNKLCADLSMAAKSTRLEQPMPITMEGKKPANK